MKEQKSKKNYSEGRIRMSFSVFDNKITDIRLNEGKKVDLLLVMQSSSCAMACKGKKTKKTKLTRVFKE